MKILKRLSSFTAALMLSLSSLLIFAPAITHAAVQTCGWLGTSGDGLFSTSANWTSCGGGVPLAGDIISFDNLHATNGPGSGNTANLTDDLGVALGGVVATQDGSGASSYYAVSGLTFADGATIDLTGGAIGSSSYVGLTMTGQTVTGQGALTVKGVLFNGTWNITGELTVASGSFGPSVLTAAGVTVQNSANFFLTAPAATNSFSIPLTLGGGSGTNSPIVGFGRNGGNETTWNVTSAITLLHDAFFSPTLAGTTVNVTGAISGTGFALKLDPGAGGNLNINPSSNTSATVAGSYTGTGVSDARGGAPSVAAPGAPDTGFAQLTRSPALVGLVSFLGALAIAFIARKYAHQTNRR